MNRETPDDEPVPPTFKPGDRVRVRPEFCDDRTRGMHGSVAYIVDIVTVEVHWNNGARGMFPPTALELVPMIGARP